MERGSHGHVGFLSDVQIFYKGLSSWIAFRAARTLYEDFDEEEGESESENEGQR